MNLETLSEHPFPKCYGCAYKPFECRIQQEYIRERIGSILFIKCPCMNCIVKLQCKVFCDNAKSYRNEIRGDRKYNELIASLYNLNKFELLDKYYDAVDEEHK